MENERAFFSFQLPIDGHNGAYNRHRLVENFPP